MKNNEHMSDNESKFEMSSFCPVQDRQTGFIKLGHGSGGRMTDQLISEIFQPVLNEQHLNEKEDAAVLHLSSDKIAFTTDSYVVSPLIFPGGDIGSLSVHGTVNDLSMRGARPLYLSAAFTLEEGLECKLLDRVVSSMKRACLECNVHLVAADTKVVNRGGCDKLFITTSGVGLVESKHVPSANKAKAGDSIILSGDVGRHGMAIMAARENIDLECTFESDSAPLIDLSRNLLRLEDALHTMRDITRGGLASVLNEIAVASNIGIELKEGAIPVISEVKAVCEILGLDPLYVACEGRMIAIVSSEKEKEALELMRAASQGEGATVIGRVVEDHKRRVVLRSLIGGRRIVDKLSGEQLPRIC